jgi:hypothetical protein
MNIRILIQDVSKSVTSRENTVNTVARMPVTQVPNALISHVRPKSKSTALVNGDLSKVYVEAILKQSPMRFRSAIMLV